VQEERGAFFHGHAFPRFIGGERGLHGELGVLGSGLLMGSDNLCRICGIEGLYFAFRAQAFSADHQLVFVAEHVRDFAECAFHGDEVGGVVEIGEGFIAELALRGARQDESADV
jgi:hypothetical protein